MLERLHTPPNRTGIPEYTPLVFLAGPIQGARDWQSEAASDLIGSRGDIHVASPRRLEKDENNFDYNEQVAWEKQHLKRAAKFGSIIFWLEPRDASVPYEKDRPYGKTTAIEFGRLIGWLDYGAQFPFIAGIDPRFSDNQKTSERYLRTLAVEHDIQIIQSLDQAIDAAIRETPRNNP